MTDITAPTYRPHTPKTKVVKDDGTTATRITAQRACNGCGNEIGDATDAEIQAAIAGQPLPDVRGECPTCTPRTVAAVTP